MKGVEVIVLALYMDSIFYTIFEVMTWWLIGSHNFPEVIKVLNKSENMLGRRVNHYDIEAAKLI